MKIPTDWLPSTYAIAIASIGVIAPAMAAPTHLTCPETNTNYEWQVPIDTDRGYAKVDTHEYGLSAGPTELFLESAQEGNRGIELAIERIWINRQTLAFRRVLSYQSGGEWTRREASGQCRITPVPAGRQI